MKSARSARTCGMGSSRITCLRVYVARPTSMGTTLLLLMSSTITSRKKCRWPRTSISTQSRKVKSKGSSFSDRSDKPTVCLDVTSLVASSYGYENGETGQFVAHELAMHVAKQLPENFRLHR